MVVRGALLHDLTRACALGLVLASGCGGGGDPSAQAQRQLEALAAPGRVAGVSLANDNDTLSVLAPSLYPEVQQLLQLGAGGNDRLIAALADPALDANPDGDRVRALAAFVLEQNRAMAAVPALLAHLTRSFPMAEERFSSMQAAAHALAVLRGQTALVKSLYGLDKIQTLMSPTAAIVQPLVIRTKRGREIEHEHLIGPNMPPASRKEDFPAFAVADLREFWEQKKDGLSKFEDPVQVIDDATWSFDCHSWTFRRDDTRLPDKTQRYHILGESVPTILEDEGYVDVTAVPAQWRITDAIVFYKAAGGTPTHTGRLSFVGKNLSDPELRFTSKWSVSHPTVNVSVRDAMKLYGKVVKIWQQVEQCVVEVKAGGQTSCARRSDGTVWCWGNNQSGQLGDGTTVERAAPVQVQGLTGAVGLSVGSGYGCAVKGDGTVWCWGSNESGQLGDGTKTDSAVPVQVKSIGAAAQVAAHIIETCAREQGGGVICWGGGSTLGPPFRKTRQGPPPNDPPPPLTAIDLSSGFGGFSALSSDGILWGWNGRLGGFPGTCTGNWTGGPSDKANQACPVTTEQAMLADPPRLLQGASRAAAVGRLHACVLVDTGVTCWGTNEHGQLGRTTPSTPLFNYTGPVSSLAPAVDVAANDNTTCARLADGKVWCWGDQFTGTDAPRPVEIMGLEALPTATSLGVAVGSNHACALSPTGVQCWGSNLFGQLGTGDPTLSRTPTPRRAAIPCPTP